MSLIRSNTNKRSRTTVERRRLPPSPQRYPRRYPPNSHPRRERPDQRLLRLLRHRPLHLLLRIRHRRLRRVRQQLFRSRLSRMRRLHADRTQWFSCWTSSRPGRQLALRYSDRSPEVLEHDHEGFVPKRAGYSGYGVWVCRALRVRTHEPADDSVGFEARGLLPELSGQHPCGDCV
jgi:hypothetical protein